MDTHTIIDKLNDHDILQQCQITELSKLILDKTAVDDVTEVATDGETHKEVNMHFHTFLTERDWDGIEHVWGYDDTITKIIARRAANIGMLFPAENMFAWLGAFAE